MAINNIELVNNEYVVYQYSYINGLLNHNYHTFVITNFRFIIIHSYKPWWYFWFFLSEPIEVSHTILLIKHITSIQLKTRFLFSNSSSSSSFPFTSSNTHHINLWTSKNINHTHYPSHSTTHDYNDLRQQQHSLNLVLRNAFLKGLLYGLMGALFIWYYLKTYRQFIPFEIGLCVLIYVFFDFLSYQPVKYLVIYTIDNSNNEDIDALYTYVRGNRYSYRNKKQNELALNDPYTYYKKNAFIVEGDIKELINLQNKLITILKNYSMKTKSNKYIEISSESSSSYDDYILQSDYSTISENGKYKYIVY